MYVPTVYIYWMHVYTWEMYIHGLCIEALVHWWCHQDIIMSNRLLSPKFVIVAELKIICWCLWIIHCYIYIPSMYIAIWVPLAIMLFTLPWGHDEWYCCDCIHFVFLNKCPVDVVVILMNIVYNIFSGLTSWYSYSVQVRISSSGPMLSCWI